MGLSVVQPERCAAKPASSNWPFHLETGKHAVVNHKLCPSMPVASARSKHVQLRTARLPHGLQVSAEATFMVVLTGGFKNSFEIRCREHGINGCNGKSVHRVASDLALLIVEQDCAETLMCSKRHILIP